MLKEKIQELAKTLNPGVIQNRRYLHQHPELSFAETNTAAFIKQTLDKLNIPWQPMARNGVVALVSGEKPSEQVIALRADMDALPIEEANQVPYKSGVKGVMHACGHDAHTASLLGTAQILKSLKSEFGGTVKFIFQPAEERMPGGANQMIQEGVLENPEPTAVIGQHVFPAIPTGKIGIRGGRFMASMDELYLVVKGKGGHGAQPQDNIDPVLIAAHLVVALQQLVSRMASPQVPTVLSFGKMIARGATNIIPSEVYLEGTFRTLNETWREDAHHRIRQLAEGIAESMGGSCDFKIVRGYPYLKNNEALSAQLKLFAGAYLGPENVLDWDIWMASEDFAYFSHQASSCFYLLGIRNEAKGITSSLHTPTFNLDEDALELSTGLMAYLALKQLGN